MRKTTSHARRARTRPLHPRARPRGNRPAIVGDAGGGAHRVWPPQPKPALRKMALRLRMRPRPPNRVKSHLARPQLLRLRPSRMSPARTRCACGRDRGDGGGRPGHRRARMQAANPARRQAALTVAHLHRRRRDWGPTVSRCVGVDDGAVHRSLVAPATLPLVEKRAPLRPPPTQMPHRTVAHRVIATAVRAAIDPLARPELLLRGKPLPVATVGPVRGVARVTPSAAVRDRRVVATAGTDAAVARVRNGSRLSSTQSIRSSIGALRMSRRKPAPAASHGPSSSAPSPTRSPASRNRRAMCCSAMVSTANFPASARHGTL